MTPVREIRIRSATLDDAAGIAEVHVASWRWASRVLTEHTESVLVADDGRVRGLAAYGRERDEQSESVRGELYALYVERRVARCGVGRALHDHAGDALRLAGHTEAVLWVLDGNERALDFYARCGWTRSGATMAVEFAGESRIELKLTRAL